VPLTLQEFPKLGVVLSSIGALARALDSDLCGAAARTLCIEEPCGTNDRDHVMNRRADVDQRPRHLTRTATPSQMANKE
jgi:hypothetical protein